MDNQLQAQEQILIIQDLMQILDTVAMSVTMQMNILSFIWPMGTVTHFLQTERYTI